MNKAVISDRIYMNLPENKQDLFSALTYKIEATKHLQHGAKQAIEVIRNYKMVAPNIVSIPQGRVDLIPEGYEIIDKRVIEFADFPAPTAELYPEQKVIFDEVDGSCFINALPGWGKTFTALYIAAKLGQKTLVVTHTAALRDQWIKEVEILYNIKPGIIGGGIFNTQSPIVISNVQSLVKCIDRVSKLFGTIIMDEAHHTPASTFTQTIDAMYARYRIALSGTMKRKDGKHILFPDYFGHKVFKPAQNNTIDPTIKLIKVGTKLPHGKTWADKVTNLLSDPEYQDLIASMALVQARKGHKVLIVADRTSFLESVKHMLGDRAVVIIGETKDRDTEISKLLNGEADILCGSRQIFSEGISVNILSCLILAVPMVNHATLEQVIGRIMRLADGKLNPEVLDLQFSGATEKRQNSERINLYLEKGWKMEYV